MTRRGLLGAPRPRYARICAALTASLVTAVTVLGGVGLLPTSEPNPAAASTTPTLPDGVGPDAARLSAAQPAPVARPSSSEDRSVEPAAVPARSGRGRRVVFDISEQRVWLVGANGRARRTYLVSGSLTRNLRPGDYEVYSTSRWAVGVEDSGVMQYFVRFTRGAHAAIGFHSIPTKNGRPLQARAQLGTPRSHGCIRQALPDARAMWEFAPVGTEVVVLA